MCFACIPADTTQIIKSLRCEWQSCLECLLQAERSTPMEKTTVINFKINITDLVVAFTYQQPVLILTLRHFHSDRAAQCNLEKPRLICYKMLRSYSPLCPGKYPPSWPTPLKLLKLYSTQENNWRRKELLGWQIFCLHMHVNSKKQFFIYQGWFLHGSGNCHSSIYLILTYLLRLYGFFFKTAPKTPSHLKNMSVFQCILLCTLPDLKANTQLLLLALT